MPSQPKNRPEPMADIQPTTYQDVIALVDDTITTSMTPPQKKIKKIHNYTQQNPLPPLSPTDKNEKSGDSSIPLISVPMNLN